MDLSAQALSANAEWKRLRTEAASLYEQGELDRAYRVAEQAAAAAEASFGPEDKRVADSLADLAVIPWTEAGTSRRESSLERALAIREKALPPGHPDLMPQPGQSCRRPVAIGALRSSGRTMPALPRIQERLGGPDHLAVAGCWTRWPKPERPSEPCRRPKSCINAPWPSAKGLWP